MGCGPHEGGGGCIIWVRDKDVGCAVVCGGDGEQDDQRGWGCLQARTPTVVQLISLSLAACQSLFFSSLDALLQSLYW